ncbi:hypothetical protein GON03_05990 [Nocardioides sp. MAH-18]|uniref:PNPLA domain-containing protein n=1 Tax=Nocardioides agri TaxID=2682843 RepID=A0A6L6XSV6_9ACTN|nr:MULTISPECIES: hypothetical protein [unclassified Nocardioides]MBA2953863.1 hypothetical protein [Nocardioides sp. CGMCC 1.13656]MVQ48725.1 hypothetical protein [Nocardioides sp. MAH-18]
MAGIDDRAGGFESAPASAGGRARIQPGQDAGTELAAERSRAAVRAEQRKAIRGGLLLLGPVLFLALLAFSADRWPAGRYNTRAADVDAWARGLLSIVLLVVSVQLVAVLVALEHTVGRRGEPRHHLRLILVWGGRLVVACGVALAVLVGWAGPDDAPEWWDDLDRWGHVVVVSLAAEAFALACLLAMWWRIRRYDPSPRVLRSAETSSAVYELMEPADPAEVPPLRAIGASGGGIRATAFVLGGHQAVQDRACRRAETQGVPDPEPHVFAVSGGSYAAAALAMRRAFRSDGSNRPDPTEWTESYRLDSPELERLRRHTRYLFEPRWRMQDGLISLLMGAAVNIIIIGVLLRLVTWVSAEFALITGVVELTRNSQGRRTDLDLAPGWDLGNWFMLLGFSLICAVLICVLTLVSWWSTSAFDSANDDPADAPAGQPVAPVRHSTAIGLMNWSARLRRVLFLAGLGWLLLVLGLPAATVAVVDLTTSNRPTTTAASVLDSVGFGTRSLCTQALVEQLNRAAVVAGELARVSPDEPREVTAGACGVETTVSRTVASNGTADVADDVLLPADDDAARDLAETRRIPGQVAGLTAVLLFVLGLLRRGPSPETSVEERWTARMRRVVMTWLPLAIMIGVVVYLMLLWTLRFMIYIDPLYTMTAAVLTVGACAVAYLLDANATSLHNFYRGRLSDAFAVAVDEGTGRATQLPSGIVYNYSDLAARSSAEQDPRLHVIATLNSQAPNEAPTMRGGFPVVFGARELSLHREERQHVCVPMRDYERFAGPGRVSIMASVAISGAAISPLMGRYGSQTAPYRFLLALFNIRVGTWVSNPMHTPADLADIPLQSAPERRARWTDAFWLTRKPGLAQVALEAVGNSSADRRWVYLSDGGHLDNTGLVEAVRFCVEDRTGGRILVLDASNDPPGAWSAVGDAISVVRADLGVDLRRVDLGAQPPWMRVYQGSGLEVVVVKAVRVEVPGTAPAGSEGAGGGSVDWSHTLPPDVVSFQLTHKDFPRSSTGRQKFGDLEFEAYRSFGYAVTAASLDIVDRSHAPAPSEDPP